MTIKGTGRREWRSIYPADEWDTADTFYIFDLKYVLFRKRGIRLPNPPAAIMMFDHTDGFSTWEVIGEADFIEMRDRFFEMKRTLQLVRSPEELPNAEAKALKASPDYGRF